MIQCFVKTNCRAASFGMGEVRLLSVSRVNEDDCAHPRVMHAHEDFAEIVLTVSGEGEYLFGSRKHPFRAGDLIIYNSGVVHDEAPSQGRNFSNYSCAIAGIEVEGLRKNALVDDTDSPVIPSGKYFQALHATYALMFGILSGEQAGTEESCQHLLGALLSNVWQAIAHGEAAAAQDVSPNLLGLRVKRYIDAHYMEDISLQTLADALGLSPYYIAHAFKHMSGYSPMQYLLRRRIGEAQTLLITTKLPITQVAQMVGYDTPSQFNLHFTKNVGISPRKYRTGYVRQEDG